MSASFIEHNSFKYGNTDMWDAWELRVLDVIDYLKPKLRQRTVTIPLRNGEYEYNPVAYECRDLTLKCIRMSDISRSDQSELAYALSTRRTITLYDNPDRYYIGRIYKEPELSPIRNGGLQVTLEFKCDPFMYGRSVTEPFSLRTYKPQYQGTAPTPTTIIIENTGTSSAVNIVITQTIRKEN